VYEYLSVKKICPRYIGVWSYIGSSSHHSTVGRFQSPYTGRDIMTLYVVHVHSWHVMSCMDIHSMLCRAWAFMTRYFEIGPPWRIRWILGLQKSPSSACEPTWVHETVSSRRPYQIQSNIIHEYYSLKFALLLFFFKKKSSKHFVLCIFLFLNPPSHLFSLKKKETGMIYFYQCSNLFSLP
jgi:hypothetical protein